MKGLQLRERRVVAVDVFSLIGWKIGDTVRFIGFERENEIVVWIDE